MPSDTYNNMARLTYSEYKSCKEEILLCVTWNLIREKLKNIPLLTKMNLLYRYLDALVKRMTGYADLVVVLEINLLTVFWEMVKSRLKLHFTL